MSIDVPAYAPDEIVTGESTRASRLKWVVVVDSELPPGRLANAVACVAAATGEAIAGLLGPGGDDAAGAHHPGLPWAGCTVLGATAERMRTVREKAVAAEGVWLADMPLAAQTTRVYDDYLAMLGATGPEALEVSALSLVGPRATVDSIVKKLRLL
ncbi:DUF2000 domain-containing protein [Herbiconiux sp. KACC 21604]|uniref:DUF2000 domain-containing protein n=1 Tax=unclassified Herbiconiux TaxID=2618217 RepID=UPI001491E58F|nr:DUF2000 domain-containing protein [Herbiconiux sp. SALV-R1]QJU54170.1 DUF2000 domain-containing protein [Herbiconiux sp. SALV-R1]WPO85223.1 DUF2000 domain-containing protein [Herbiconiux sp. KACC 21604]